MIDIHSHTLWGLDDGSRSLNTSVEMCRIASESGTEVLFLTPHIVYWENAEDLYDLREEKTERLEEILDEYGVELKLVKGFEILCDDDIFDIKYFKPYTLGGTRYILIEFDFEKPTEEDVISWCNYLISQSLVPVIAHPERYRFVKENISVLEKLSDKGVLFQINCGSPLGMFGDSECNISLKMLKCGYVDFIGSDAHDTVYRSTNISELIEEYPETVSEDVIFDATERNPQAVINNEIIETKRKGSLLDV